MIAALQHDIPLKQQSIEFLLNYTNTAGMRLPIRSPLDVLHKEFGINRALHLMKDYGYEDVVTMGLQLVITHISKNGTIETCNPTCIQTILHVLSQHLTSRRIQIRGCSIFLELCDSQQGRIELVKNGALSLMMEWYTKMENDVGCKQLSLMCISSLCQGLC